MCSYATCLLLKLHAHTSTCKVPLVSSWVIGGYKYIYGQTELIEEDRVSCQSEKFTPYNDIREGLTASRQEIESPIITLYPVQHNTPSWEKRYSCCTCQRYTSSFIITTSIINQLYPAWGWIQSIPRREV